MNEGGKGESYIAAEDQWEYRNCFYIFSNFDVTKNLSIQKPISYSDGCLTLSKQQRVQVSQLYLDSLLLSLLFTLASDRCCVSVSCSATQKRIANNRTHPLTRSLIHPPTQHMLFYIPTHTRTRTCISSVCKYAATPQSEAQATSVSIGL